MEHSEARTPHTLNLFKAFMSSLDEQSSSTSWCIHTDAEKAQSAARGDLQCPFRAHGRRSALLSRRPQCEIWWGTRVVGEWSASCLSRFQKQAVIEAFPDSEYRDQSTSLIKRTESGGHNEAELGPDRPNYADNSVQAGPNSCCDHRNLCSDCN